MAILIQLAGLSGQLGQGLSAPLDGGSLDTTGAAVTFTAPFDVGSSGAQVAAIQSKLLSVGYTVETNGEFGERPRGRSSTFRR